MRHGERQLAQATLKAGVIMRKKYFEVQYAADKTVRAQHLGGRLARIDDYPLFDEYLWKEAIVRLSHLPDESNPFPWVVDVVSNPFPERTDVIFYQADPRIVGLLL